MSIPEIIVKDRETTGKEESGRIRRAGRIPCVVYGLDAPPRTVTIEPKLVTKIVKSEKGLNTVMNLKLEDSDVTRHVMIKDVTRHPLTDRLLHVDFLRVDMNQPVTVVIPIRCLGQPAGVKLGGVLTIVRHEVEVTCLPKDLPGTIEVDVSGLAMDEAVRVSDLPKIDGVTVNLEAKRTIAVVHAPDQEAAEDDDDEIEAVEE